MLHSTFDIIVRILTLTSLIFSPILPSATVLTNPVKGPAREISALPNPWQNPGGEAREEIDLEPASPAAGEDVLEETAAFSIEPVAEDNSLLTDHTPLVSANFGLTTQTITLTVNASSDDAKYEDGSYDDTATMMFLGTAGDSGNPQVQTAGWRFTSVPIPQGAQIQSAKMSLVKAGTHWIGMEFNWYAEASGDAASFSPASTPEDRARTTATVFRNDDVSRDDGVRYELEEIKEVVQEVVDRADWAGGNALVILARADWEGWARTEWRTYDYSPADAAQLVITYVEASSPPEAAFSAEPQSGLAPLAVTFTNSSTNATDYLWTFGDGSTSIDENPVYTYTTAGVYTVTLNGQWGRR